MDDISAYNITTLLRVLDDTLQSLDDSENSSRIQRASSDTDHS